MALTADGTRAFGTLQNLKSGTSADFTADKLIELIYTLKNGYRANASFMMNTSTLFKVRTMKNVDGDYLASKPELGQPSQLLATALPKTKTCQALQLTRTQSCSVTSSALTQLLTVSVLASCATLTQQMKRGFYTTKRVGGMLTDSQAVKVLTLSV